MEKNTFTPVHFSFFTKKEQALLSEIALEYFESPIKTLEEMKTKAVDVRIKESLSFCRHLPFVQKIFLVNSYSFGAPKPSDYDLFILVKKDHLFFGRIFATLIFHLLKKRRHGNKIHQRFCLSFWAGENVSLKKYYQAHHFDWYFVLWEELKVEVPIKKSFFSQCLEWFFQWKFLENLAKSFQQYRFEKRKNTLQSSSGLVVNEEILKFHNEDRRDYYYQEWMKVLEKRDPLLHKKIKLFET